MERTKKTRRKYSAEFKADAVRLARTKAKPVKDFAADLGIHPTMLGDWIRQADVHEGGGSATDLTSQEREELARLRRENKVLREEREILKKAAAFFASEKA
jgi:transposase